MFSDIERSPSWHSPALTPAPPPQSHHLTEFQHPHLQHQQHQSQVYTPSSSSSSSSRPPVQSGWFPLQDTTSNLSDPIYADTMLPPPPQRHHPQHHQPQQQQWTPQDTATSPYMHVDTRQPGHAGYPHGSGHSAPPTEKGGNPSMYTQSYHPHTPVQDMNGGVPAGAGFGWQDARPMAPPAIHTTGLEHLRGMGMASSFDDNYRVHQAAQGMHAMMGMPSTIGSRYPTSGMEIRSGGGYGAGGSTRKKSQKEISIGRWTSDEHRVFLRGLETYQGPAWGEIARMIGTRTSTQVRTHAQKFFTKLARSNQVMPYFESQIQKERTRLISQGAVISSQQSSVTPTSTTAHSYTFSTLSPPRKREYAGPRTGNPSSYDDHHSYNTTLLRPPPPSIISATSSPYLGPDQASSPSFDMFKPRFDLTPPEFVGARRHRLSSGEYSGGGSMASEQPVTPYGDHHSTASMMAYPHPAPPPPDAYRDPVGVSYAGGSGDWNDVANRHWQEAPVHVDLTAAPSANDLGPPGSANDPDSLPSVTRLLYRGTTPP